MKSLDNKNESEAVPQSYAYAHKNIVWVDFSIYLRKYIHRSLLAVPSKGRGATNLIST